MDIAEWTELEKQAQNDIKAPDNIEACMNWQMFDLPNIQYEWSRRWAKQKFIVETLKDQVNELYGKKLESIKFGNGSKYTWSTQKEIDCAIECDTQYCALVKQLRQQTWFLNSIEEIYKNICRLDYKTHDFLDYYKTKTKSF